LFHIGPFRIDKPVLLAPMAGVSDAPYRSICQQMGAGLTTSEMLTTDTRLWQSRKSRLRLVEDQAVPLSSQASDLSQPAIPRSIQIAGSDPSTMAEAAKAAVDAGAELIDINMGCPAKKVCNKAAGSALLRDEALVAGILEAVVAAVSVPVTLKIRTGWCPDSRNGLRIATIAENAGIQALAVHGRTRACRFAGRVEYETIAAIVKEVRIPVIANGDIDSPQKAAQVLEQTGAAAVMIGRAAQGQPWIFRETEHYLRTREALQSVPLNTVAATIGDHLGALHEFYGDYLGVRIARKHVKWYLQKLVGRLHEEGGNDKEGQTTRRDWVANLEEQLQTFNKINSPDLQHAYVQRIFERLITKEDIAA
jgi:tRNA-dihydrouridine synthase B